MDFIIKTTLLKNPPTLGAELMSEVEGLVQGHRDGHGFVVRDDRGPDLYLSQQEMRAVLHRDRVKARVIRYDRKGRPEGRILEILERKRAPIIGRLLHESGVWLVAPEDKRYGQDILIPKNAIANAAAGQVVAIELTEPPSMYSQPVGRVTEVLGEIDDPGMEIEIAVRKYEVPHLFSPQTLAQAAALPDKIRPVDRKNRIDLTDVALVTIDGEDARDFDDAVYCEPARIGRVKSNNGWRLIVAIADVSHYVKPGEPLDADAYERATSVYFPRRVIPMLPEKLSNGLCSLNPNVERLRDGLRHAGHRGGRDPRLPVLPGGDLLAGAPHVHRGRRDPREHARTRGGAARRPRAGPAESARGLSRVAEGARASAARSTSRPPRRRSSATRTDGSRRSCRARAPRRTS